MARILIVEDEPDLAMVLADDLTVEGYSVEVVRDGLTAASRAREPGWDLILLDLILPRRDGLEITRELRRSGVRTPIIMLTARSQEGDKILGLEYGVDDYVTKPFSPRELRARIKAMLRRGEGLEQECYRFGDTEVDFARGEMRRGGRPVDLTRLEFKLLAVFVRRRGRVLSREHLIDLAWGGGTHVTDRAVDQHIVNLRRKIDPKVLVSVRGLGYRFDG